MVSVILTIHDREQEVLLVVLRQLTRGSLRSAEIVVVLDGPTRDYSFLEGYLGIAFPAHKIVALGSYERYSINGYGNPAKAFNAGLEAATGEKVVILSSDTLVMPPAQGVIVNWDTEFCPITPRIINIETSSEYCGVSRIFPMPWCLAVSRQKAIDCGGWDERYLDGLCYEDNDFVGRLICKQGGFAGDWQSLAYHISHDQPAYNVADEAVMAANQRNKVLTMKKWGGIPFDPDKPTFDIVRVQHESGVPYYAVRNQRAEAPER